MERLTKLIKRSVREGFTDLHITGGRSLAYRKEGQICFDRTEMWSHKQVDRLVLDLLSQRQLAMLRERLSVDLAKTFSNVRVRMNIFNATRGLSISIRLLPGKVPTFENLNLHPSFKQFCSIPSGLILVCGATGSGKSTTIAAMLEEISQTRQNHVITLEDPIEYRFGSFKSFVQQRELGPHFTTFEQGLLDVLREDPDVIMVGELREPETIRLTLNAAESGHLVIASLHATNSEDALHRICNSFPADSQDMVRTQLSSALSLLIVQKLQFRQKLGFRVPCVSILKANQAVKGTIRDNRFSHIESILQTGTNDGMFTMKKYEEEFLDLRKQFQSPALNLAVSPEMTLNELYVSPVLEGDGKNQASVTPKKRSKTPVVAVPSKQTITSEGHYVIDENESMEDLIYAFGG